MWEGGRQHIARANKTISLKLPSQKSHVCLETRRNVNGYVIQISDNKAEIDLWGWHDLYGFWTGRMFLFRIKPAKGG